MITRVSVAVSYPTMVARLELMCMLEYRMRLGMRFVHSSQYLYLSFHQVRPGALTRAEAAIMIRACICTVPVGCMLASTGAWAAVAGIL